MPLRKTDGSCFKLPQPERKPPQLLQGSATGLFTPSDNLDGSLAQQEPREVMRVPRLAASGCGSWQWHACWIWRS